jgi:hypothetical protein
MKKLFKTTILPLVLAIPALNALAQQDAKALVDKVKAKLDKVSDYEAGGKMKTNVAFLKVPVATVKVYYKKPSKFKIKNEKGVSFVPKGAVNINLGSTLSGGKYSVIDAGKGKVGSTDVRIVKLLPDDDNADLVLSTLYIDETNLVILKSVTSTSENGKYQLDMTYGKYLEYGLPDKVIFSFNTKDYKLPKGVTFDYDDGNTPKPTEEEKEKRKKGKVEIDFSSYSINKGLADAVFQ